jgi:uncharacterized protein with HEPN domain
MTEKDVLYLEDIAECIERIDNYTKEGREVFLNTPLVQDAVIRNFEVIGEATKNLSAELKAANPDIRWRQIAGLRDVLIHEYAKVNLPRVWNVIEQDLPGLRKRIKSLLEP